MRNVIVVPCKRDSARYPYKNRDLIKYHVSMLVKLNLNLDFEVVIVTDDEYIEQFCIQHNLIVIDRPKWTTWTGVDSNAPICHAIDTLNLNDDDVVCLLELTHVNLDVAIIKQTIDKKSCLCLSVTQYPMRKLMTIVDGDVLMWNGEQLHNYYMTSQNIEPSYIPAGVMSNTVGNIKQFGGIYTPGMSYIIVNNDIDVDIPDDINALPDKV